MASDGVMRAIPHVSASRFSEILRWESAVYQERTGLPKFPFNHRLSTVWLFEFDVVFTRTFWKSLARLGALVGDESIVIVMQDPDARNYYLKNFGVIAAFEIRSEDDVDTLVHALRSSPPDGNEADAIAYCASTVQVFGSTGRWGIWAEREAGIGIFAADGVLPVNWGAGLRKLGLKQAISQISLSYRNQIVPPDFVRTFTQNFGDRIAD